MNNNKTERQNNINTRTEKIKLLIAYDVENEKRESTTMEIQKKYENGTFASIKQTDIENVSDASYPMDMIHLYWYSFRIWVGEAPDFTCSG